MLATRFAPFIALVAGSSQAFAGPGLPMIHHPTRFAMLWISEPFQASRTPASKVSPAAGIKNVATSIILLLGDSGDVFPRVTSTDEMAVARPPI